MRRKFEQSVRPAKVQVSNYRSCLKTAFKPNPGLSVLIGINASGASNVLNSILLLKKLLRPIRRAERELYAYQLPSQTLILDWRKDPRKIIVE